MQDLSFIQAMNKVHSKISNEFQESIAHLLRTPMTVAQATANIQDEHVRGIVSKTLIVGQLLSLLSLMEEMDMLSPAQHKELRAYVLNTSKPQLPPAAS